MQRFSRALPAQGVGRATHREIGIRKARGQAGSHVRLRVLADAVPLGLIGVALGAAVVLLSARYL